MNTGFLGPAVATVLTVYGIETFCNSDIKYIGLISLQQCLPFTVLKLIISCQLGNKFKVATVLTVYGIETITKKR